MTDRPTHITDRDVYEPNRWDAATTRCGIPLKEPGAMPYVGARFVRAHVEGRATAQRPPIVFCPECKEGDR